LSLCVAFPHVDSNVNKAFSEVRQRICMHVRDRVHVHLHVPCTHRTRGHPCEQQYAPYIIDITWTRVTCGSCVLCCAMGGTSSANCDAGRCYCHDRLLEARMEGLTECPWHEIQANTSDECSAWHNYNLHRKKLGYRDACMCSHSPVLCTRTHTIPYVYICNF
jgi:hypothetical protein